MQSTNQNGLHKVKLHFCTLFILLAARKKVSNSIQNFAFCDPVKLFTANTLLLVEGVGQMAQ